MKPSKVLGVTSQRTREERSWSVCAHVWLASVLGRCCLNEGRDAFDVVYEAAVVPPGKLLPPRGRLESKGY